MATKVTQERDFEEAIEAHLIDHGGYERGTDANFDPEKALIPATLIRFLKETQEEAWGKLSDIYGSDVEHKVLDRIAKELDARGMIDVIRNGVRDRGQIIKLAYFKPASGLNPETLKLYEQNILTVIRQVHFDLDSHSSIDLVLFVNGLPTATVELKNAFTGQKTIHAIKQFIKDRKPTNRTPLIQFKKRALVHFAVDTDEVSMATRLAGPSTFFLPFNLGNHGGKGNRENPHGHKTAYLWESVWRKDTWLDILHRFIHLQIEEQKNKQTGQVTRKEALIFPRFHQLDAVRKLITDTQRHGVGQNRLIQHSAGSGKTNTITWTAHQLASLHDDQDSPIFDSVIVISDRRNLDKQLQDSIYQFEHKHGVVKKIDSDSAQLAKALNTGTRIIITTLQKFSFILEKVEDLSQKNFAVIIDEAHSSQSGQSAAHLRVVLGSASAEDALSKAEQEDAEKTPEDDTEERVLNAIKARGPQQNLSFFAFTATPKHRTLEMFGTIGADGKPRPFHLYSMRQAIEESFILDVLKFYTTYKTYYELSKRIEDDPNVDEKKAKRAITRFVSLHPHNLAQKTEVMMEHFRQFTAKKIGGQAKAMVVTRSRLHAVRYKQAFDLYIKTKGYDDIQSLVAFSGTVTDGTEDYTEVKMNGISEKELPEKFKTDQYQLLVVAEKYQTGFDQPLLHTMYVDKPLKDLKAVQTLSRLNRTCAGKEDTFVLDFVNEVEDIQEAFKPYYELTEIDQSSDFNQLYTLHNKIEQFHFLRLEEIRSFAGIYFKPKSQQSKKDHGELNRWVDPAVSRFKSQFRHPESSGEDGRFTEQGEDCRHQLSSFCRFYAYQSQMVDFQDTGLERLYVYARHLLTKLPHRSDSGTIDLDDDVSLSYYRNERTFEGDASLKLHDSKPVYGPTELGRGAIQDEKKSPLSEIIKIINERFGTQFSDDDRLFFEQVSGDMAKDERLVSQAKANTIDQFKLAFEPKLLEAFINRSDRNSEIVSEFLSNAELRELVGATMLKDFHQRANAAVENR